MSSSPLAIVDNQDSPVQYDNGWVWAVGFDAINKTVMYSREKGSKANFTFEGEYALQLQPPKEALMHVGLGL